jgi:glycosyltransferase involved in cell wall biosynthesis
MRIAYLLDSYPALSETFIAREIEALRAQGIAIDVYALHAGSGSASIALPRGPLAVAWRCLGHFSSARRTSRWQALGARWWRSLDSDAQAGTTRIHGAFAGHLAAFARGAAAAAGLPFSFGAHARDVIVPQIDLAAVAGAASAVFCCNRAALARLQQATSANGARLIYAPHGLDLGQYCFEPRRAAPGATPHIVSVGRLVEKKGYHDALQAFAIAMRAGLDFRGTIGGDGPLRAATQRDIERSKLRERVTLAGALPHGAVITLLQSADCLLFAGCVAHDGDRDGLPNVLLEAAALGVPLLATEVGGVTDFVDATTGRLCRAADPAALAVALTAQVAESAVAKERAVAARARVEQQFDSARNVEVMIAAWRSATAAAAGEPATTGAFAAFDSGADPSLK